MEVIRYYVNFPSRVDGSILCEYFKDDESAKRFAQRFGLRKYSGVKLTKGSYELQCIDQEINLSETKGEEYNFPSEQHHPGEFEAAISLTDILLQNVGTGKCKAVQIYYPHRPIKTGENLKGEEGEWEVIGVYDN